MELNFQLTQKKIERERKHACRGRYTSYLKELKGRLNVFHGVAVVSWKACQTYDQRVSAWLDQPVTQRMMLKPPMKLLSSRACEDLGNGT